VSGGGASHVCFPFLSFTLTTCRQRQGLEPSRSDSLLLTSVGQPEAAQRYVCHRQRAHRSCTVRIGKTKSIVAPPLARTPWSPPAATPGVCVRPSRRAAAPRRSAPEHGLGRRSTPTAGAGHAPPWGRGGPARGDVGGMARRKPGVEGLQTGLQMLRCVARLRATLPLHTRRFRGHRRGRGLRPLI
jgi:hypothetical protein